MPYHTSEMVNLATELYPLHKIWNDVPQIRQIDPAIGFWSFQELCDWVEGNLSVDIYASVNSSNHLDVVSVNGPDIEALIDRNSAQKQYKFAINQNGVHYSLLNDHLKQIDDWIKAEVSGKFHKMGPTYFFKEDTDAMLFDLKWRGDPDIKFV